MMMDAPSTHLTCAHLAALLEQPHLDAVTGEYRAAVRYLLRVRFRHLLPNNPNPNSPTHVDEHVPLSWWTLPVPTCAVCHDPCSRLHACLECTHMVCRQHLAEHLHSTGHRVAINVLNCAAVFCAACDDYVYALPFDIVYSEESTRVHSLIASHYDHHTRAYSHHDQQQQQQPPAKQLKQTTRQHSHMGIRGLRNLGATCFMNVILQAFLHTPPLRAWFFSDRHHPSLCSNPRNRCLACQMDLLYENFYSYPGPYQQQSAPSASHHSSSHLKVLDQLLPWAPTGFLWAIWGRCRQLVGYDQQDAHEFFIGTLDALHEDITSYNSANNNNTSSSSSTKDQPSPPNNDPHFCACIIHQLFSGRFQSRLTCMQCHHETIVNDPFLDVSLDVRPVFSPIIQAISKEVYEGMGTGTSSSAMGSLTDLGAAVGGSSGGGAVAAGGMAAISQEDLASNSAAPSIPASSATAATSLPASSSKPSHLPPPISISNLESHSLYECLDRFTHQERLLPHDYRCSKCAERGDVPMERRLGVVKQLSFWKLPVVLTFQLKRYDHHNMAAAGSTGMGLGFFNPIVGAMSHYSSASASADPSGQSAGGTAAGGPTATHASSGTGGGTGSMPNKITMMVRFPLELDMYPYTTPGVEARHQHLRTNTTSAAAAASFSALKSSPAYKYALFAVIVHHGTFSSGHYTCYVRQSGRVGQDGSGGGWLRFNDHLVTSVEWREVRDAEAYMVFYCKEFLEYD